MTPQQIDLVQSSFKKVVPIAGTAADLFYDRLFEIAPEVRSMFPQDLSEQKKKLMGMLGTAGRIVSSLCRLPTAVPSMPISFFFCSLRSCGNIERTSGAISNRRS